MIFSGTSERVAESHNLSLGLTGDLPPTRLQRAGTPLSSS